MTILNRALFAGAVIAIFFGLQLLICTTAAAAYGDKVYSAQSPVPGASGLTFDGQYFWSCGNDGLIYQFSAAGAVIHTIPMPDTGHMANYHPDVAWDGTHLWFANYCDYNAERTVMKLDPQNGSVLADFRNYWINCAGDDGFGLAYSAYTNCLALSQGSGYNRMIVIDAADGEFVLETPLSAWPMGGLALSSPYTMWASTSIGILCINPVTGYIHSLFETRRPLTGLAWTGGSFLLGIESSGMVHVYDISPPYHPDLTTIEPMHYEYFAFGPYHWGHPLLSWTAEGCTSFDLEVSINPDFTPPNATFPLGNITRYELPGWMAAAMYYNLTYYWRIRGTTNGGQTKLSDTRTLTKVHG